MPKMKSYRSLLCGKGKHVRHVEVRTAADIDPAAFAALIVQVAGEG